MRVEPYLKESESTFTAQSCMNVCKVDPKCSYYFFTPKIKTCTMYSQPEKECSGYLGIPKKPLLECGKPSNSSENSIGMLFCLYSESRLM